MELWYDFELNRARRAYPGHSDFFKRADYDLLVDIDTQRLVTLKDSHTRAGRYLSYNGNASPGRKVYVGIEVPSWLSWTPAARWVTNPAGR
jgi:hypothetical protein